jgi:hypothetical protein
MPQTQNGKKLKNFVKIRNNKEVPYYKPLRKNSNNWYFANLDELACKQVWEAGQAYYARVRDNKIRHSFSHPVELTKYFYMLWLTGARLRELLLQPSPAISFQHMDGGTQVIMSHVNEKHKQPNGERDVIDAEMPLFDEWEQKMWLFITDGVTVLNTDDIFKFSKWGSIEKSNLSHLIKTNFKLDLRDPNKRLHHEQGITPHILRHMRMFNVVLQHNVRPELAIKWFGWNNIEMVYYYAHIRQLLSIRNQHVALKNEGLLTLLTIRPSPILTQ